MGTRRIWTVLIITWCWLGVQVAAHTVDPASSDAQKKTQEASQPERVPPGSDAAPADREEQPIKVEVIEEIMWGDGQPQFRREGYRDAEGNPVPHGVTTQWWENGERQNELTYVHGELHGPRLAWYRNGAKRSEGAFNHGKSAGTWTGWYADGVLQFEWAYDENGANHGMYTLWHPNGQKMIEVEYVHGRKQGFETAWDEEGNIRLEVDFGRGEPQ